MTTRTITLTNRPPVKIDEDNWPVLASASDKEYDGQVEYQANRMSKWGIYVRQHEDRWTIVYASYSYTSNWQNARCYAAKQGKLLTAEEATADGIVQAIRDLTEVLQTCEHHGDDAARWVTLADECIADLPAEEI